MKGIISRNPYTGQVKQQISYHSSQILDKCFQRTSLGFKLQSKRQPKEKMGMIRQLIPQIERSQSEISKLITFQTGKPILEAQNQVKQALKICEYYSKHAQALLSLNVKSNAKKKTLIKYMPLGTVFCILPFVNPLSLTLHHTLPQLLLGNCLMVKNSSITPGVSKLIEKLIMKSGFQSGQYQTIFLQRERSEDIISRSEIVGVSFTGSSQSGKRIGALAGKYLKISSLHLSSNDSMAVMEDADLNLAIDSAIKVGFYNSGQAGASPKRIIVHQSIYQQFKLRIIQKARKAVYGNPLQRQTSIGPLYAPDLFQKLQVQIKRMPSTYKMIYQEPSIQKPFFPITIIQGEEDSFDEQIMGPLIVLLKAKDNRTMIEMANNTKYGNNNYVFSSKKGQEIIDGLRGGAVYLNRLDYGGCHVGRGGMRQSGYGRARGYQGIRQFANTKTVYIN